MLCNCDDPYESNFFYYFASRFNDLGLKKLIATCYDGSPVAYTQLDLFGADFPIAENLAAKNAENAKGNGPSADSKNFANFASFAAKKPSGLAHCFFTDTTKRAPPFLTATMLHHARTERMEEARRGSSRQTHVPTVRCFRGTACRRRG